MTKKKGISLYKRKDLMWGSVSTPVSDQKTKETCAKVAAIYDVPPMCVNMMGNQPYLNKDGRLYLLKKVKTGNAALLKIETEFLQMSTAPDMSAICKKRLIFKDGFTVEAIGEAGKNNIKLDAVKNTPNMMAETRALNRVIWQAIAMDVWDRVERNLKKMKATEDLKDVVIEAGKVSYEEIDGNDRRQKDLYQMTLQRVEAISNDKRKLETALSKITEMDMPDVQRNDIIEKIETAIEKLR